MASLTMDIKAIEDYLGLQQTRSLLRGIEYKKALELSGFPSFSVQVFKRGEGSLNSIPLPMLCLGHSQLSDGLANYRLHSIDSSSCIPETTGSSLEDYLESKKQTDFGRRALHSMPVVEGIALMPYTETPLLFTPKARHHSGFNSGSGYSFRPVLEGRVFRYSTLMMGYNSIVEISPYERHFEAGSIQSSAYSGGVYNHSKSHAGHLIVIGSPFCKANPCSRPGHVGSDVRAIESGGLLSKAAKMSLKQVRLSESNVNTSPASWYHSEPDQTRQPIAYHVYIMALSNPEAVEAVVLHARNFVASYPS
jgi:hypothetical protein